MLDNDMEQRTAIMKEYCEKEGIPFEEEAVPLTEPVKAEKTTEEETSEAAIEKEAEKVEPEATAVKVEETKEEPRSEQKPVTSEHEENLKKALHEEREKRKAAQAERKALEERLAAMEAAHKTPAQPSIDEDEAAIVPGVAAKLAELERWRAEKEARDAEHTARQEAENFSKLVESTASELDKAGYPGFMKFHALVGNEITSRLASDPDFVNEGPKTWAKIYTEVVYPDIAGIFKANSKREIIDAKKAAKQDANLAAPGKPSAPPAKDDDEDTSFDSYLKRRMSKELV